MYIFDTNVFVASQFGVEVLAPNVLVQRLNLVERLGL
jgi:hypothetical protein